MPSAHEGIRCNGCPTRLTGTNEHQYSLMQQCWLQFIWSIQQLVAPKYVLFSAMRLSPCPHEPLLAWSPSPQHKPVSRACADFLSPGRRAASVRSISESAGLSLSHAVPCPSPAQSERICGRDAWLWKGWAPLRQQHQVLNGINICRPGIKRKESNGTQTYGWEHPLSSSSRLTVAQLQFQQERTCQVQQSCKLRARIL